MAPIVAKHVADDESALVNELKAKGEVLIHCFSYQSYGKSPRTFKWTRNGSGHRKLASAHSSALLRQLQIPIRRLSFPRRR